MFILEVGVKKNAIIISLLTASMVEKLQYQRLNSIIYRYRSNAMFRLHYDQVASVVVNAKILQVSTYTFLTLSIYKVYCLIQVFS